MLKPSMLGLLIAAAAFGASTIYLAVQLRDERAQSEAAGARMRDLQVRIDELERARAGILVDSPDLVEPEPRSDAPLQASPAADATPAAAAAAEVDVRDRAARPVTPRSDASRNLLRANLRSRNRHLYQDVGEALGLSREQAGALIDLLTDQQVAKIDGSRDDGRSGRERNRLNLHEAGDRELTAIADLIGADKIATFREYQNSIPARQEVDTIAQQLEGADAGLSEDQRDRMIAALTEERARVPAPEYLDGASRDEYREAMAAWREDYQTRSSSRAQGILTREQFQAYDDHQRWMAQLRREAEERRAARRAQAATAAGQ